MTFEEYQEQTAKTAIYPGQGSNQGFTYTTLGIANEAGEFVGKVKKLMRDGPGAASLEDLMAELGDLMWYVSQSCNELGIALVDVAEGNIEKLTARADAGTLRGSGDDR